MEKSPAGLMLSWSQKYSCPSLNNDADFAVDIFWVRK